MPGNQYCRILKRGDRYRGAFRTSGGSGYLIATHRLHSPSGRDLSPPSLAERGRSFNPGTRAGNGDEVFDQSCGARNVSQLATSPDFRPFTNQRVRCAEEPCVKASGTT